MSQFLIETLSLNSQKLIVVILGRPFVLPILVMLPTTYAWDKVLVVREEEDANQGLAPIRDVSYLIVDLGSCVSLGRVYKITS